MCQSQESNPPPIFEHESISHKHPVVIFDGVCNFCHGAVNFIIKHDPSAKFRFAPSQSDAGAALIKSYGLEHLNNKTLVLIKNGQAFIYSAAAFAIAKDLHGPCQAFSWLRFLPKRLCDFGYKLFARHRYALFGKKAQCMVPTDAVKARFLP